jgi:DNA-directed RNA polymerase subunit K
MINMIGKTYTKYEIARLIGARALQISHGAPIAVKTELKNPIDIAKLEFEKGVLCIDTMKIAERVY